MSHQKRSAQASPYLIRTWRDITPMNVSMGTMLHNLTGGWRFVRPLYEDKIPACQNACPAGGDIEGWIRLLQEKGKAAAFWHLKEEQPFPAVLGRVCFSFCQSACNRNPFDERVNIRALECFVGDAFEKIPRHPRLPEANNKALAVVGSGPSGMSAAYFGALLGYAVTLFEAGAVMGGILRGGIPRYRLPKEVVHREFDGLSAMGVCLRPGVRIGKDITLQDLQTGFDFVFLGTGAHRSLRLHLDHEEASPRILSGLNMLKKEAEGRLGDLGKKVVVIGGGNTAIDAARTALRKGADVTVVYRRTSKEMPAHPEEVHEAEKEGVSFICLAAPEQIDVTEEGAVSRLVCSRMALGEPDASGRRRPVRIKGSRFDLFPDTILTAIGESPALEYLEPEVSVEKDALPVDATLRVTGLGFGSGRIYAGGDATNSPRTVAHAVAAGKRALIAMDCCRKGVAPEEALARIAVGDQGALSFSAYRGGLPEQPVKQNRQSVVKGEQIVYDYFFETPAVLLRTVPPGKRIVSQEPYVEALTDAEADREVSRCLHCGRCTQCDNCLIFCPDLSVIKRTDGRFGYWIDYDYCKGCGICFAECPRGAISLVEEEAAPPDEEAK